MSGADKRSKIPELSSRARGIAVSIGAIDYLEIGFRGVRTVEDAFESGRIFKVWLRA